MDDVLTRRKQSNNRHSHSKGYGVDDVRITTVILVSLVIFLIWLLKSKTITEFGEHPVLFVYSLCITTFYLFRMTGALFYRKSYEKVIGSEKISFEPKITFVVPCKNEERDIEDTITKCFSAEYPSEKVEVIVINDGSTDRTIDVLNGLAPKYPNLRIVDWEINRGKREAMVAGFKMASGEIIIQLDSDSYIYPHTVREIVRPFLHPEIGAVCAHADPKNADENFLTKMQTAYYFVSFRIFKATESSLFSVFCCSGCSSAYRRDVVLPILDSWNKEMFLGLPVTWGDDRSLTTWVLKQGFKTIYTDRARACTIVPNNFRTLLKQQLRWKKSWIVNSIITARFLGRKHPYIAFVYYIPLVAVSFLNPIMFFYAFIWPLFFGLIPVFYIVGVLLMTSLIAIYYKKIDPDNGYWPYLYPWSVLNIFVFTPMLVYALIKIQDRGWGTR